MRAIDKELQDYVTILNDEQKKTILGVVKTLVTNEGNESDWEDEAFVAEIDKQSDLVRHRTASAAISRHEGRNEAPGNRN